MADIPADQRPALIAEVERQSNGTSLYRPIMSYLQGRGYRVREVPRERAQQWRSLNISTRRATMDVASFEGLRFIGGYSSLLFTTLMCEMRTASLRLNNRTMGGTTYSCSASIPVIAVVNGQVVGNGISGPVRNAQRFPDMNSARADIFRQLDRYFPPCQR